MSKKLDPLTSLSHGPKTPGLTSVSCLFTWLGTRGDYSSITLRDQALKGWRRNVSSYTPQGRFNIVVATYITTAVTGFLVWKRYKQRQAEKAAQAVTDTAS